MDFELRTATIDDEEGILNIIRQVWGSEDFINRLFRGWLIAKKENNPIVAIEKETGDYAAIGNLRKMGDYGWLEGLRVIPKFRGNKISTSITEMLITKSIKKNCTKIGYATGYENHPMHKVAETKGFTRIGQEMVLKKRRMDSKKEKLSHKMKLLDDNETVETFIREKYNNRLLTSFLNIPENNFGKKLLENIPMYETKNSFLIYESNHQETTVTRGVFTIYMKNKWSIETLLREIETYESLDVVKKYEIYSFAVPVDSEEHIHQLEENLKDKNELETHFLVFYEKELLN